MRYSDYRVYSPAHYGPAWFRMPTPELAGGPESEDERPPRAEQTDWASLYPNEILLHGPDIKEVALTFDDGPDTVWTPQILNILNNYGVKATFFCVGQRIQANPGVFMNIIREGHEAGNHSWNHPNLAKIPVAEVKSQIVRTDEEFNRLLGVKPAMLRPPYGALNRDVIETAISLGEKIILWNVDSMDWNGLTGQQVAANILSNTGPGSIILMHSATGEGGTLQGTVDGLPRVIERLYQQGYRFRTVSKLLDIPAYRR